jgi:small subunit ribosomal protein S4
MRKLRKKFKKPRKAWSAENIKENKKLMAEYGLRRKREILRSQEILRRFRQRARELIAEHDEAKTKILIDRMARLGLLSGSKGLDDVLALGIRDVLDRRLQTIILRKGFADTPMQARQLISHGFISVDGKRMKFPAYIVPVEMEGKIGWCKEKPVVTKPKKKAPSPKETEVPAGEAEQEEQAIEEVVADAETDSEEGAEETAVEGGTEDKTEPGPKKEDKAKD